MKIFVTMVVVLCTGVAYGQEMPGPDLSSVQVLELQMAQKLALQGNPSLAAAQARVEQAKMRVEQAVAQWWPDLDLTAAGNRQRLSDSTYDYNKLIADLYGGEADRTTDNFSVGAQATWVLFDGFARTFNQQIAEYGQQSQEAALMDSRRQLIVSVAQAFFNAQLAQTNVDISKADEAFYLRQLEDAQNRYDVGAGPWGDILNIKVQLNSAKTSVLVNQRSFEAAGYGLAALLGLADATLPEHVRLAPLDQEFQPQANEEPVEAMISSALASRPDVRQMELAIAQAEASTGAAKAPFYPRVQLAGALNGARQGDVSLTGEDFGNTVSISMAWNLFNGGEDKAALAEARHARREAAYTLANLKNQVASEIRQQVAQVTAARDQVRLQRESVGLVKENRDLAQNEYEAGEASLVRLNEAQRDLTTTYGRLAQALVGYHQAQQQLLSATGRNLNQFPEVDEAQ